MDKTAARTKPTIELNMSLLGGSSVPHSKTDFHEAMANVEQDPRTQPHAPHETLLKEAVQWIRELETIRDHLHMLSVRNAILLDSLAMAGATEVSEDEEEDDDTE